MGSADFASELARCAYTNRTLTGRSRDTRGCQLGSGQFFHTGTPPRVGATSALLLTKQQYPSASEFCFHLAREFVY